MNPLYLIFSTIRIWDFELWHCSHHWGHPSCKSACDVSPLFWDFGQHRKHSLLPTSQAILAILCSGSLPITPLADLVPPEWILPSSSNTLLASFQIGKTKTNKQKSVLQQHQWGGAEKASGSSLSSLHFSLIFYFFFFLDEQNLALAHRFLQKLTGHVMLGTESKPNKSCYPCAIATQDG